jgi:alpha-beta hydrolase superfamily lysophospholipase
MTKVSFYSGGLRIAAQLHEPAAAGAVPRPAIVMVQGMVGRKELFGFPRIAERFNALGYVALTFDYRGIGESEGERGRLHPLELVEDARSAVDLLAQQPGVDPSRIALWGTSFGGAAVPLAAALDRRVCAAISIAGFGDGERWLMAARTPEQRAQLERRIAADRRQRVLTGKSQLVEPSELFAADPETAAARARVVAGPPGMDVRTGAVTLESVERILEFRPSGMVKRIAPRPALFIAAERDLVTPVEGISDMHRHAREPRRLEVLPGITHYEIYAEPHIGRIVGWTHALLGGPAARGA